MSTSGSKFYDRSRLSTFYLFYDSNKTVKQPTVKTVNAKESMKTLPLQINGGMDRDDDIERKNYEKELNSKINWSFMNATVDNDKIYVSNIVKERDEDEQTYTTEIEEQENNIDDFQTEIFPFEN